MKLLNIVFTLILIQLPIQATLAESTEPLPGKIKEATDAYKGEGVDAFIPTLLKDSPLADDKSIFGQVNSLKQIESFYGVYLNAEHIKTINITKSTRISYYMLNYEKGPVYGVATLYRTNKGEIVTQFNVHTTRKQIIPDYVMGYLK